MYLPKIAILVAFGTFAVMPLERSADLQDDCYPITARDLRRANSPSFDRFPAGRPITKWVPADVSGSPQARTYRTVLQRGTVNAPNFAERYTIVAWGCGTSCVTFAIVNRENGKVIFPDNIRSIDGAHLEANDFERNAATGYWGLRFRRNSRLLILVGAINEDADREGAFYFAIEGDRLKPLFSARVKKRWCR